MNKHDSDHWLVRPSTIRRIWQISIVVLTALVLLQLVIKVKGYFGVDSWPAFGAVFGFASCVLMVLVAKVLGWVLKRPEDYYLEDEDRPSGQGGDDA